MKRNVTKKLVAVALAAAMAMTAVGCGNSDSGSSGSSSPSGDVQTGTPSDNKPSGGESSGGSDAPKEVAKPDTISWWTHDGLNEENGAEQWFAEFEKFTGIHLDHQFIPNNEYYDKLKLAFASHEVPEVFDLNGANLALYASQAAINN